MTQGEILELLEKVEKPLSNKEITKLLRIRNAGMCLRKLAKHNDIKVVAIILDIRTGSGMCKRPILHYFV